MTRIAFLSTPWQASAACASVACGVVARTMGHAKRAEKGSGSP